MYRVYTSVYTGSRCFSKYNTVIEFDLSAFIQVLIVFLQVSLNLLVSGVKQHVLVSWLLVLFLLSLILVLGDWVVGLVGLDPGDELVLVLEVVGDED